MFFIVARDSVSIEFVPESFLLVTLSAEHYCIFAMNFQVRLDIDLKWTPKQFLWTPPSAISSYPVVAPFQML